MDKKNYIITLCCLLCLLSFACGDETDTPPQASSRAVRKKISPPPDEILKPAPQSPELAKADTKPDGAQAPAKPEKTPEIPSKPADPPSELAKADIKTDGVQAPLKDSPESKTKDKPDISPQKTEPAQPASPSSKNGTVRKKIVFPSDSSEQPKTEIAPKPDESETKLAEPESKPKKDSPNEKPAASPKKGEKKESTGTAPPGTDGASKPDNAATSSENSKETEPLKAEKPKPAPVSQAGEETGADNAQKAAQKPPESSSQTPQKEPEKKEIAQSAGEVQPQKDKLKPETPGKTDAANAKKNAVKDAPEPSPKTGKDVPKASQTEIAKAVKEDALPVATESKAAESEKEDKAASPDTKPAEGDAETPSDSKTSEEAVSGSTDDFIASLMGTTQKKSSDKKTEEYSGEGKIDPFEPLFKEETPTSKEKLLEAAEPPKKTPRQPTCISRTPLQKVDLGQLKLVGVIRAQSGNRALVQEASGKGYIVTKGTYIGIRCGRVSEILQDKIIVEEEDIDFSGEISTRTREIKLQRPPGEEYYGM